MDHLKERFNKLRQEEKKLRHEVKERTVGYIVSAFGLVAALAWNQAIQALIGKFFPNPGKSIVPELIYAVIVTLVVVVITIYLTRLITKKDIKS